MCAARTPGRLLAGGLKRPIGKRGSTELLMARTYQLSGRLRVPSIMKNAARPRQNAALGPGMVLGVCVVMMVVVVMVMHCGECRGGKHHQKQGSGEHLFHATNVARPPQREKWIQCHASRQARGSGNECHLGTSAAYASWLKHPDSA